MTIFFCGQRICTLVAQHLHSVEWRGSLAKKNQQLPLSANVGPLQILLSTPRTPLERLDLARVLDPWANINALAQQVIRRDKNSGASRQCIYNSLRSARLAIEIPASMPSGGITMYLRYLLHYFLILNLKFRLLRPPLVSADPRPKG
jgi:hypothetical protein